MMAVCCCSLAGTAACQHCQNNPMATDVWPNKTVTVYHVEAKPFGDCIDVAPARHGMNIEQEYDPVDRFRCSECGIILEGYREVRIDEDDGDETNHEFVIRFCPNCGARIEVDG